MKHKVNIPILVLALTLISAVAAGLLGGIYLLTKEPITVMQQEKRNAALREVLPAFDNQPSEETVELDGVTFYIARKDGQLAGFAGEASSDQGFNGNVTVLAGIALNGELTTVLVTQQAETPGLGTVVTDRKREKTLSGLLSGKKETGLPPNRVLDQFSGMKAETGQAPWTVKKDGGTLDAVTGATITSRAVADAVFTIAETFAAQRETLISESAGARESLK